MKYIFVFLSVYMLIQACNTAHTTEKSTTAPVVQTGYICPMKCEGEKYYATNVKCPDCAMDLELVGGAADTIKHTYKCPTHTDAVSNTKGMCAACGKALEEVK